MKEQLQLPTGEATPLSLREFVRQKLDGFKWRQRIRQMRRDLQREKRRRLAQSSGTVQETFKFTEFDS